MTDHELSTRHKVDALHRKGAIHLWQEIFSKLEADIGLGRYSPGDKLPSEAELAQVFEVHRNTVRHALTKLEEKGLIRTEHGAGSFVQERTIPHALGRQKTLPVILSSLNRLGRERVLCANTMRTDRSLEYDLHLGKGQYVRRVDLLTIVDEAPVMVSSAHFPLPRFHGIERAIEEEKTVPAALKKFGVTEMVRQESRITASQVSRADAALLGQPRSQPVLKMKNTISDGDGRPVLLSYVRMSARWIEIVIRYNEL
jgi:GntR family transcriptional regulator, phosphonate transport system regulatory protein